VLEAEAQAVDLEPVAELDQSGRLLPIPIWIRPAGQPQGAVSASLCRAQRCIGIDLPATHLEPAPDRLEDGAPWELAGPVAEHRPVRHLARGGPPGADGVENAARPASRKGVQVRRVRRLVAGPAAEHVVRPVAEAVQQDDDDREH
jgi:hypothetical protein